MQFNNNIKVRGINKMTEEYSINKIKLTDFKPADYNPRHMQEDEKQRLRTSIESFGLVDPIIVNLKNNRIIGGHQRWDVLVDMVMEETNLAEKEYNLLTLGDVGLIFDEDITIKNEDYEKALNIALNKISGEWDYSKLSNVLDDLKLNHFNLELTGFDDLELNEFDAVNDLNFDDDEDFTKDEFDNLIEEYEQEHQINKDGNWLYIEYYNDDERYNELLQLLKPYITKGEHEIDNDWFYNLIKKELAA